ncbi:Aste57867_734 [Aphanomyces stellatus]|uniref:Aste57867_734 protein n=1 Tax=Aphanomyces stellatus TaxID=120398 RepID=A0A485K8E2_9STRA|nr:hypothetical protein As57867_000733 [Aphanomyces stellatus]VFT77958.1 Aste57867_734 [Aphanomyces stellatus]
MVVTEKKRDCCEASMQHEAKDLIEWMLLHLPPNEVLAHIMTLLIGGQENGSMALSWTFALLASHLDVVAKIRSEYNSIMRDYESLVHADAMSKIPFTHAVIQETLRLYSPALFRRICTTGEHVPTSNGDTLYPRAAAMHRNPIYWTNPHKFVPERSMDGTDEWNADLVLRGGKGHSSFYIPFGMGGMQCLAYRYIMVNMEVVVATFVGRLDFELAPDARLTRRFNGLTMSPSKLKMTGRAV